MYKLSAGSLRDLFVKGELSAEEIANYYLKRAQSFDEEVGAFLRLYPERMMAQAKALDVKRSRREKLGKLAAVPIAIKDNMHIEAELTTCGSKFLSNFRAPFSATAVRLLEHEDALFIGKTNLDEFAMGSSTENSAYKLTHNPWDLRCTPGGSSGGSAAAVAARLSPLATGSDTGGSIRQPAALCGCVGFKPTYGRVSRYGLVAFGSSLDQIGPFANRVEDVALMMEVIAKHCDKDSTSLNLPEENTREKLTISLKGKCIGVPWKFLEGLGKEARENFEESLVRFKEKGAEVVDINLDLLKYSVAIYYILATAEASTNLARFDGIRYGNRSKKASTLDEVYDLSKEEGFGAEVKNRILLGTYVLSAGFQDAYYRKAQKVRTLIIAALRHAFAVADIIAMPCSPFAAFPLGSIQDPLQMYLQDTYTISANLAGVPAISLPSGFSKEKKPFGLQLIGPQMQDSQVLAFAKAIELPAEIPPLFDREAP